MHLTICDFWYRMYVTAEIEYMQPVITHMHVTAESAPCGDHLRAIWIHTISRAISAETHLCHISTCLLNWLVTAYINVHGLMKRHVLLQVQSLLRRENQR